MNNFYLPNGQRVAMKQQSYPFVPISALTNPVPATIREKLQNIPDITDLFLENMENNERNPLDVWDLYPVQYQNKPEGQDQVMNTKMFSRPVLGHAGLMSPRELVLACISMH